MGNGLCRGTVVLVGMLAAISCDAGGSSDEGEDGGSGGGEPTATTGTAQGPSTGTSPTGATSGGAVTIVDLIDDLEDGDGGIYPSMGRVGYWYTYNDETAGATQTPVVMDVFLGTPGGPGTSLNYAGTVGSGFTTWGAGMGFDFNNPGDGMGGSGLKGVWSAAAYQGVAFHAKGTNASIRMKVLVEGVVPSAEGGTCAAMCTDAHGKIIPLSADWAQYSATWDELFQEGWGTTATFDPTKVMGIQFQVGANVAFDFGIDEIGFF